MTAAKSKLAARRDHTDIVALARYALDIVHSKLCQRLTLNGYLCYWCKGDSSE